MDGIDLGTGMLLPFLAKEEDEKKALLKSIGPVWNLNEMWLIIAGSVLFLGFHQVFSACVKGLFSAILLAVICFSLRAAGITLRFYDEKRKKAWDMLLSMVCLVLVLSFGIVLGNMVQGVAIGKNNALTIELYQPFTFFSVMTALLGLCAVLMQAAAWAVLKTTDAVKERALSAVQVIQWMYRGALIFFIAASVMELSRSQTSKNLWFWALIFLAFICLILLRLCLKPLQERLLLAMSSVTFVFIWASIATLQFPFLIRSTSNWPAMTIYNTAGPLHTLKTLVWVVLAAMTLVVLFKICIVRKFSGRTRQAAEK